MQLGYSQYLQARELTSRLGQPLLYLLLLLGLALIVVSLVRQTRPYGRHLVLGTTLLLGAGFLLLVWFHYQINAKLQILNPMTGQPLGRFYVPVWIESEKLYFWTLVFALLVIVSRKKPVAFTVGLNVVLGILAILTVTTSNPFREPLATFNEEYRNYYVSVTAPQMVADPGHAFQHLYGKMVGYYNSQYMWTHPLMLFIAYATFTVSFLACIFMLAKGRSRPAGEGEPPEGYDKIAYAYAKPGYILLTVGMLLGYPWAVSAWADKPWWYDPKVNVTLMMWVLYSAYLHSRLYLHRRGMWSAAAILGLVSFVAVVVTYITTYVVPGIHSMA